MSCMSLEMNHSHGIYCSDDWLKTNYSTCLYFWMDWSYKEKDTCSRWVSSFIRNNLKGTWLLCVSRGWDQGFQISPALAAVSDSHWIPESMTMINSTESSEYVWDYEYYYDYIDPVLVNASTLKYNRCELLRHPLFDQFRACLTVFFIISDSIVIIFWIILAAFIGFFFLIMSFISHSRQLPR